MLKQAKIESDVKIELTVKLIQADGSFKGLVLNMAKTDGRLLYIGEGKTETDAWNDAQDFVAAYNRSEGGNVWQ